MEKRESDLPLGAILHDSVLNGVQEKRLGRSYGFDVIKQSETPKKKMMTLFFFDPFFSVMVRH